MPAPDTISVEIINFIDSIEVSPVDSIDSIEVNTVPEVTNISVDNTDSDITIDIGEDPGVTQVDISVVDVSSPVQSVNGKTGHVVLDYPDINDNPVNHVRYTHIQNQIPFIQISGKWHGYYIWTINHNLNFYPNITVFDSGENMIEAYIDYNNTNTATIVMNSAISGTAYLS
jgi:hypothetical protein